MFSLSYNIHAYIDRTKICAQKGDLVMNKTNKKHRIFTFSLHQFCSVITYS